MKGMYNNPSMLILLFTGLSAPFTGLHITETLACGTKQTLHHEPPKLSELINIYFKTI